MLADQAIASREVAKVRQAMEQDLRYANITIIEEIGASQLGIGMVSARIAEIVLGDERAVVMIGVFNPRFGVILSMPGICFSSIGLGRESHREGQQSEASGQSKRAKADCSLVRRTESAAEREA